MSQALEFILVPKKQYLQKEPLAAQVLNDPENKHPSAHLSYIHRFRSGPEDAESRKNPTTEETKTNKNQAESILKQIEILDPNKFKRANGLLTLIEKSDRIKITENDFIQIDDNTTNVKVSEFLFNLQQPTKKINTGIYGPILKAINATEDLVINSQGKKLLENHHKVTTEDQTNLLSAKNPERNLPVRRETKKLQSSSTKRRPNKKGKIDKYSDQDSELDFETGSDIEDEVWESLKK